MSNQTLCQVRQQLSETICTEPNLTDSTIDHEKVDRIRKQLANGTLKINTQRLAEKILALEDTLFQKDN